MSNFHWTNSGELYININVKISGFPPAYVHISSGFGGIYCVHFTEGTKNLSPYYLSSFFCCCCLSPLVKWEVHFHKEGLVLI